MTNLETIKDRVSVAEDFARKIWLAGLGAYGKSYEEIQGKIESVDVSKVFEDLVAKGEKLETEAKDKIKEKTDFDVKGRVEEVREKLGMNKKSTNEKIDDLTSKIESLAATVEKLTAK